MISRIRLPRLLPVTIAALALRTADRILATLNEGGLHADA